MRPLTLHLRGEYFDDIKAGRKSEEYRLASLWAKRIKGRKFSHIVLLRGYPKRGDESRTLRRAWVGYRHATIAHPHFGTDPVAVIAINVALEVAK